MSKKEIILSEKEVWEMVEYALQFGAYKWNIPNGAYKQRFEITNNNIKLILTETEHPNKKESNNAIK